MPRIREARPEDALAVAAIHVRAWQRAYRGLIADEFLDALRPQDRAARYTFGSRDPEAPRTLLAVAEPAVAAGAPAAEELLGFATFGPCRDPDLPAAGEIHALYVDPERWRGGTGRLLLARARAGLRERGHREAVLWVLLGNEAAERFYEADGWRRDGAERTEQPYGVISRVRRFRRALS
ncbi:MAG: GNAT family N-acetyltransferase [Solirubrobacterales bacterium]